MRRRGGLAVATIIVAIGLAAALAVPGGAAPAQQAVRTGPKSHTAATYTLVAKHPRKPPTGARRQALIKYIKAHPAVLAAHRRAAGQPATKKPKKPKKPKKKSKKAKPAAAKRKKKKKKKKASTSLLHRAVMYLGGLTLVGLALFLIGSSLHNAPRARAKARARARTRPVTTR